MEKRIPKLKRTYINPKLGENNEKRKTSYTNIFATDDKYIPFLAVALQSLIENSSDTNNYVIKILYTNIEEENMNNILKYERENVSIEFVDLNYYINKVKDKLYTRDLLLKNNIL